MDILCPLRTLPKPCGGDIIEQMKHLTLTAIIERDADGYVSLCPELDIASQGQSRDEARANLTEAIEAFMETASPSEIQSRLSPERYVESLEINVA